MSINASVRSLAGDPPPEILPYPFRRSQQGSPVEDLILQICKITDPEESMGRTNLTIKFLINNSDFSTAPSERTS
jgi:hypothetical protein